MKDRKANSGPRKPPLHRPIRARSEVGGERRRLQTPSPTGAPPLPPPGQARKSAAGGIESKLPVQLSAHKLALRPFQALGFRAPKSITVCVRDRDFRSIYVDNGSFSRNRLAYSPLLSERR